jgi:large repetitive protein
VASLAPGAKIVCKATHAVTQADLDAGSYTNTAKGVSDELPAGVTGAATLNFTAGGSLQVVKTVTSTGPYAIGNNATFTVKVTNNGSMTLKSVTVSEQADAVLGSCTPALPAMLTPSQSLTCAGVSHVITAADQAAGTYHNTATATGLDPSNNPVNAAGSADVATPPTSTALSVTKTVTSAGPYAVGANINFSIAVTNTGTAALTGVNVTEQADATLGTCTVALPASLTPGQSFTCTARHVVTAADLVSGTYTNVATGTGTDPRGGAVTVTGVASAATPQLSSDMQIIKTLTSDLLAGSNSTWQILVRNAGPGTATGVSVSDIMPAGLTYVSASGSGWSCSAVGSVVTCTNAASVATGTDLPPLTVTTKVTATTGTITNVATVSSTSFDAEQANNISSANGPVKAVLAAGPTPTPVPAPVALPETGSDVGPLTTYGMTLILLGMAMFVLTRRRPAHR